MEGRPGQGHVRAGDRRAEGIRKCTLLRKVLTGSCESQMGIQVGQTQDRGINKSVKVACTIWLCALGTKTSLNSMGIRGLLRKHRISRAQ